MYKSMQNYFKKYFNNYFRNNVEVHRKIILDFHRAACINNSVNLTEITPIIKITQCILYIFLLFFYLATAVLSISDELPLQFSHLLDLLGIAERIVKSYHIIPKED